MSASDNDRAGDLLIQEVDEELRREQYQKLWERYGNYIIAAVVAVVLIVAGYQGWQGWQAKRQQEQATRFAAAQQLADEGKNQEALDALAKVAGEGDTGFALAAGMRRADVLAQKGDKAGAVAAYESIVKSGAPAVYRDLATIKEALLTLDDGDAAALEGRIAPLTALSNPWHYSATELLALLAQKKGDKAHAVELYKQIADDLQAPAGLRGRAAEMLAVLSPAEAKPAANKTNG